MQGATWLAADMGNALSAYLEGRERLVHFALSMSRMTVNGSAHSKI